MIQRRTQTAAYWREQFAPTEKDTNYLYGLILDGGKSVSTSVLAQALIDQHCRQEEAVSLTPYRLLQYANRQDAIVL